MVSRLSICQIELDLRFIPPMYRYEYLGKDYEYIPIFLPYLLPGLISSTWILHAFDPHVYSLVHRGRTLIYCTCTYLWRYLPGRSTPHYPHCIKTLQSGSPRKVPYEYSYGHKPSLRPGPFKSPPRFDRVHVKHKRVGACGGAASIYRYPPFTLASALPTTTSCSSSTSLQPSSGPSPHLSSNTAPT